MRDLRAFASGWSARLAVEPFPAGQEIRVVAVNSNHFGKVNGEVQSVQTNGHGEKVTRKQELAVAALLAETTLAAAAAKCGVSESTLCRWLQDDQFQTTYRSARRAVLDGAVAALQQTMVEAVSTLRRALNCGQANVEVRAAGVILGHVLGTLDRLDLDERLRRLEAPPETRRDPSRT